MPTALRPLLGKLIGLLVAAIVGYLQAKHGLEVSDADKAALQNWLDGLVTVAGYVVSAYAAEWLLGVKRLVEKKHTGVVVTPTPKPPVESDRQSVA